MRVLTRANLSRLILDGEEFFNAIFDGLDAVARQAPAPNTYVRLAYWEIEHDLVIAQRPRLGTIRLDQKLREVADRGHRVEIIMWSPARLDVRVNQEGLSGHVLRTNLATARLLSGYQGVNPDDRQPSGGSISVLMEVYNGWNGSSVHQKIALFSLAGSVSALIGGLNLAAFYRDDEQHRGLLGGGMGARPLGNTVHDAAVEIAGPATVAIENEWLRRWQKRFFVTQLSAGHAEGTTAISDPLDFDREPRADPQQQRRLRVPEFDLEVATTNSESYLGRETDIQNLLVAEIRRATKYIYFENFVFSDPTLVQELYLRLSAPRPPKVIIMVPIPYAANPYPFDYLNFISFAKLALASCEAVAFRGGAVRRSECTTWRVDQSWNFWSTLRSVTSSGVNRWLEKDTFTFQRRGEKAQSVPLLDIVDFEGGIRFYAPVRRTTAVYIHSKVALFDDRVAVIGSANFSYRSMIYDGELSVFVRSQEQAQDIRKHLFDHYGMTTAASWDEGTVRRQADITERARHPVRVIPIEPAAYPKRLPDDPQYQYINHTFI